MPGPVGATTTPVGGSIVSSQQFGVPVATDVQNYQENVWVDYSSTFQWTGSTTNPTKGTSIYQARYLWRHPRLIKVIVFLRVQAGFAPGSGFYLWSLPFQAADSAGYGALGNFDLFHTGQSHHIGNVSLFSATMVQAQRQGDGSPVGATTVTGWGVTNDFIKWEMEYEPL